MWTLNNILKAHYDIENICGKRYYLKRQYLHYDIELQGHIPIYNNVHINISTNEILCDNMPLLIRHVNECKNNGFVYLFKVGEKYKIGRTKNLPQRMDFFKRVLPEHIELINLIVHKNYQKIEKSLHYYFKDKKHKNEYFLLNEHDFLFFNEIKSRFIAHLP